MILFRVGPLVLFVRKVVAFYGHRKANAAHGTIGICNYKEGDAVHVFREDLNKQAISDGISAWTDNHTVFEILGYGGNHYFLQFSDGAMHISVKCDVKS